MRPFLALFTALAALVVTTPLVARSVTEDDLRRHIVVLASDDFGGRAPGTEGETKTIEYIAKSWAEAGLKPAAADGSWLEPVAMIQRAPGEADYSFMSGNRTLRIGSDEIMLIGKEADYARQSLPLFFGGYGVNGDGSVIGDVVGKAIVILFDEPEFAPTDLQSARTRREALVAAGAEAVITVADSQGNWSAIKRQLLARPLELASREKRAPLEGAVSSEFAVAVITAAGGDWDKLRTAAKSSDFGLQPLGIDANFNIKTTVRRFDSFNVVGKLAGRKKGSGALLYMGHWDHLGTCGAEGDADRICNGAVDNASGIAVLTEVARALSAKRHDRDIYFVATTGEESGLLGAYAYAAKPVFPLADIVVSLNVDTIAIAPRGSNVTIIGRGTTNLDSLIEAVARKAGRKIEPSTDANAFLKRQDGWALTQKDVPALMVGGSFADLDLMQKFMRGDYHEADDELTDQTELGGAAEDADLHIALGRYFADTRKYKWDKAGE